METGCGRGEGEVTASQASVSLPGTLLQPPDWSPSPPSHPFRLIYTHDAVCARTSRCKANYTCPSTLDFCSDLGVQPQVLSVAVPAPGCLPSTIFPSSEPPREPIPECLCFVPSCTDCPLCLEWPPPGSCLLCRPQLSWRVPRKPALSSRPGSPVCTCTLLISLATVIAPVTSCYTPAHLPAWERQTHQLCARTALLGNE